MPEAANDSVSLITLGCAKNVADMEWMAGQLRQAGYRLIPAVEQAETILIHSCGFIAPAEAESLGTLEAVLRRFPRKKVILSGCLVEKSLEVLQRRYPQVHAFVRPSDIGRIAEFLDEPKVGSDHRAAGARLASEGPGVPHPTAVRSSALPLVSAPRVQITPAHTTYVKISEGCDHPCSFCIIPKLRGAHRSRPLEAILAEVEAKAKEGVKEFNLIGQDTTAYGLDLYGEKRLPHLLAEMEKIPFSFWVRLLYAYPLTFDRHLVEMFGSYRKLVPYLDMPLQHGSEAVLRRMRRPGSLRKAREVFCAIRRRLPDTVFRSTFIVGFPGETEADFELLLDLLHRVRFLWAGAFVYSDEVQAESYGLAAKVPEEIKQERLRRFEAVQGKIMRRQLLRFLGRRLPLLVEEKSGKRTYRGRSPYHAPEIDGGVIFQGPSQLEVGDLVEVEVVRVASPDLVGRATAASAGSCRSHGR